MGVSDGSESLGIDDHYHRHSFSDFLSTSTESLGYSRTAAQEVLIMVSRTDQGETYRQSVRTREAWYVEDWRVQDCPHEIERSVTGES